MLLGTFNVQLFKVTILFKYSFTLALLLFPKKYDTLNAISVTRCHCYLFQPAFVLFIMLFSLLL